MTSLAETREPFLAPYWGDVLEMNNGNTCNFLDLACTDLDTKQNIDDATIAVLQTLVDGDIVADDIEPGEPFDPFDQEASRTKFYQAAGAVLLVDVERAGAGLREVPLRPEHDALFGASALELFQARQATAILNTPNNSALQLPVRAELEFSDPKEPSVTYERFLRLIAIVRATDGSGIPVEMGLELIKTHGTVFGGKAIVKPLIDTITRGMPTIGQTVLERQDDGEPLHVKRIRSLTVMRRGFFKPPQGNVPERKTSIAERIAGVFAPSPGRTPQIADL